jgi:hypothetical protein
MEPEVTQAVGDTLVTVDTSAEDELRSMSGALEEDRNPVTTRKSNTKKKVPPVSVLLDSKSHHFEAILQILQLLVALLPRSLHSNKPSSDTRKSFDYVDAITNLMVRDSEVVAAVACRGQNEYSRGVITINLPSETPSLEPENVQVRPQYTSYV